MLLTALLVATFVSWKVGALQLKSASFSDQDIIPLENTCLGADISPELKFRDAPVGTRSFAVLMQDEDTAVGTLDHWIMFDIPATELLIEAGVTPGSDVGAVFGVNAFGDNAYGGPCPPPGPAHEYHLTLFALDVTTDLPEGATSQDLLDAIDQHILAQSELIVLFASPPVSATAITSTVMSNDGLIPEEFSCLSDSPVSPPLSFKHVPPETVSLVMIMDDPDAPVEPDGVFDHWVVYNIPPDGEFLQGSIPDGAEEGLNGAGEVGFTPPCPPVGSAHHYHFTLYALSDDLSFSTPPAKSDVLSALHDVLIQQVELISLFGIVPGNVSPLPHITLTSAILSDEGIVPADFTCLGDTPVNPPIHIENVPFGTKSLVLIVDDPDAPGATVDHWSLFNISPDTNDIAQDNVPNGARQGINSHGDIGFIPPCPQFGPLHGYRFTIYAIDTILELENGVTKDDVLGAIDKHIIEQDRIIANAALPPNFPLTLTSAAFTDGGQIPVDFTCTGAGSQPALAWTGVPQDSSVVSLVLIMEDPDAPFDHWVLYNIPPEADGIPQDGPVPQGTQEGLNGAGSVGYIAPCPPSGPAHHYHFELYAIDQLLNFNEPPTKDEVLDIIRPGGGLGPIVQDIFIIALYGIEPGTNQPLSTGLTLNSPSFSDDGIIPPRFSCIGDGVNPSFNILNVPDGTRSLTLLVEDPDAPTPVIHWVLFDVNPVVPFIGTNSVPSGARQALNSHGDAAFAAPCPQAGLGHSYHFTLFAVDTIIELSSGVSRDDVVNAMDGHVIEQTTIVALFAIPPNSALTLTSSDFETLGVIPEEFSCLGEGVNPQFSFGGIPGDAESLIFIVDDPDAPVDGGFDHWVVYNIPPDTDGIESDSVPAGAMQGLNGAGEAAFTAPCPPNGAAHHYHFTLYAINTVLSFDDPPTKTEVLEQLHGGPIIQDVVVIALFGIEPEDTVPEPHLTITSPSISDGGLLLSDFTCHGPDGGFSPPLHFENIPFGTESLVFILDDPDAPGATVNHWILFNIPPNRNDIPKDFDASSVNARQGITAVERPGGGSPAYAPPCTPPGFGHTYRLMVFALDEQLLLASRVTKDAVLAAMEGHVIEQDQITASFASPPTSELTITSPAFTDNGVIPENFSCVVGDDAPSIPLQFDGVPDGTVSMIMIMDDPDAPVEGGFDHWVVYNIPPDAGEFPVGGPLPEGSIEGLNGAGNIGFTAPCPPIGAAHHYHFTLYAINEDLDFTSPPTKADVLGALHGGPILQDVALIGLFGIRSEEDSAAGGKGKQEFEINMITTAMLTTAFFTALFLGLYYYQRKANAEDARDSRSVSAYVQMETSPIAPLE